jgi:hypothetical protein
MGEHRLRGAARLIGGGLAVVLIIVGPVLLLGEVIGPRLHLEPVTDVYITLGIYAVGFILVQRRQSAGIRVEIDAWQAKLRRKDELRRMADVAYRRGREDQARADSENHAPKPT